MKMFSYSGLLHLCFIVSAIVSLGYVFLDPDSDITGWFYSIAFTYGFFGFIILFIYFINKNKVKNES